MFWLAEVLHKSVQEVRELPRWELSGWLAYRRRKAQALKEAPKGG